MTKKREALSRIFKVAIAQEKSAQLLYQRALAHCEDDDWRSLLEGLKADEARHEQELRELQKELGAFLDRQEAPPRRTRRKAAPKGAKRTREKGGPRSAR